MEESGRPILNLTKYKKFPFWLLVVFVFSLLAMLALQHQFYTKTYGEKDLAAFKNVLHSKEQMLEELLAELSVSFEDNEASEVLSQ
jgi:hypothetical protein